MSSVVIPKDDPFIDLLIQKGIPLADIHAFLKSKTYSDLPSSIDGRPFNNPLPNLNRNHEYLISPIKPKVAAHIPSHGESSTSKHPNVDRNQPTHSWKSILSNNSGKVLNSLTYFPPSIVDGDIIVHPPMDVLQRGLSPWKATLVGTFLQFKLPFKLVEQHAFQWWGNSGLSKVILHEKGYFLFKFASIGSMEAVLAEGPKHVASKLLLLQPWKEGVNYSNVNATTLPIWVKFSNVPLSYWNNDGLSYLASSIGKPISVDATTAKLEPLPFARICVEVNAESNFPSSIKVAVLHDEDLNYVPVTVEYQSKPSSCSTCHVFGHSLAKCPKKLVPQWVHKTNEASSSGVPPIVENDWKVISKGGKQKNISNTKPPILKEVSPTSPKDHVIETPLKNVSKESLANISSPNSFGALANSEGTNTLDDPDYESPLQPNPLMEKLKHVDELSGKVKEVKHIISPSRNKKGSRGPSPS